jgi:hypothetical protein
MGDGTEEARVCHDGATTFTLNTNVWGQLNSKYYQQVIVGPDY